MITFFEVIGVLTCCILGLALFLIILFYLGSLWNGYRMDRAMSQELHTKELISIRLTNDSWWFSEDAATMNLIKAIASGIVTNRGIDEIREEWRQERAKKQV